jgi:SAM-dependent methyltransferase
MKESAPIVAGYAESIPLQGHCVELIIVAQAIHWFEPEPTRAEFLRILKPGGWLVVLRNSGTDGELNSALEGLFTEENGVNTMQTIGLPARKLVDYYYNNGDFMKMAFSFALQQTWAEFMGSLATASYMPDEDNPLYVNLENAAKRVFDRFSSDGVLDVHGTTELYLGQVWQV